VVFSQNHLVFCNKHLAVWNFEEVDFLSGMEGRLIGILEWVSAANLKGGLGMGIEGDQY